MTLEEVYKAAVENTATIKEKKYGEKIAEEQRKQNIGAFFPTVAAISSNVFRDAVPEIGPFGEGYQHFGSVNLTQPVFQGGAEYYAIKNAQKLPDIARYEREQEELGLYTVVAQAFHQVVRNQRDFEVYKEQQKLLRSRIETLEQRAKIGRSKLTEVLAAKSQLARITAEFSKMKQQSIAAKNLLKNLTGLESIPELRETLKAEALMLSPNWEGQLSQVPIIRANELLVENAKRDVKGARGSFLPSVDLDANYFVQRAGILEESVWEATLNARWEFFSGGRDLSQIRIKQYEALQLEAQLIDLKRNLQNDFKSLSDEFRMHQKVLTEMKEAVDLAEENYQEHLREANQGLVNDLEVLRVLEDYLQIRRAYDQQLYDIQVTWANLRALAGERP